MVTAMKTCSDCDWWDSAVCTNVRAEDERYTQDWGGGTEACAYINDPPKPKLPRVVFRFKHRGDDYRVVAVEFPEADKISVKYVVEQGQTDSLEGRCWVRTTLVVTPTSMNDSLAGSMMWALLSAPPHFKEQVKEAMDVGGAQGWDRLRTLLKERGSVS